MYKKTLFLLYLVLNVVDLSSQEESYTHNYGLNERLYLKLYPLYSAMNRYSLGVEYFYKKDRSVEFQSVVLVKNEGLHDKFQKNISNIIFLRQGLELFVGHNRLKLKAKRAITNGIYFSYKYVHINNGAYTYYPNPSYDQFANYYYRFSQTRNQVSCYYRRSALRAGKRFGVELYYMIGVCAGHSRNTVFYSSRAGYSPAYPMTQMSMNGLSLVNGSYVYPEIKIGFIPICRLN